MSAAERRCCSCSAGCGVAHWLGPLLASSASARMQSSCLTAFPRCGPLCLPLLTAPSDSPPLQLQQHLRGGAGRAAGRARREGREDCQRHGGREPAAGGRARWGRAGCSWVEQPAWPGHVSSVHWSRKNNGGSLGPRCGCGRGGTGAPRTAGTGGLSPPRGVPPGTTAAAHARACAPTSLLS